MISELNESPETYYLIESKGSQLKLVPSKFNWESKEDACYKIIQKEGNIQIAELKVPNTLFVERIGDIRILIPETIYEIRIDEYYNYIKHEIAERYERIKGLKCIDIELYRQRYTDDLKFLHDISFFENDLYVYSIKTDSKYPQLFILLTDDNPETVKKEITEHSDKYSFESIGEELYEKDLFINHLGKTFSLHRGSVIKYTPKISEEYPAIMHNKETYDASPKSIIIYGKDYRPKILHF